MPRRTIRSPQSLERTVILAYVRVSTEGQGESGMDLTVQRDAFLAFAAFNKLEIHEWHSDIESGAKEERAGLSAVRARVQAGGVDRVLVYKMDRLARDVLLGERVYRELTAAGTHIVSVSEAFDDSPSGQLMRTILGAFAAYERATITLRTASGRKARVAREGTPTGGPAPYGYRTVGDRTNPGHGLLRIDERQVAAVRMAFERFDTTGLKLAEIAERLNAVGDRTGQGAAFNAKQVQRIIDRRKVYAGPAPTTPILALDTGVVPLHPPILGSAS